MNKIIENKKGPATSQPQDPYPRGHQPMMNSSMTNVEHSARPIVKKMFRWEVAFRAFCKMNHVSEEENFPTIQLGTELLNATELLWYFKMDFDTPHGIKKNSKNIFFNKQLGYSVLTKDAKFQNLQQAMTAQMQIQAADQLIKVPFSGRFRLMALFYFPVSRFYKKKTGQISETLPDLSNLIELPQDCMQPSKVVQKGKRRGRTIRQGAGVISNDSHIDSLDGSRRIPWDSQGYRTELFLMRHHDGTAGS